MKFLSLLFVVILTFSLSACGDKPASQNEHGDEAAANMVVDCSNKMVIRLN